VSSLGSGFGVESSISTTTDLVTCNNSIAYILNWLRITTSGKLFWTSRWVVQVKWQTSRRWHGVKLCWCF